MHDSMLRPLFHKCFLYNYLDFTSTVADWYLRLLEASHRVCQNCWAVWIISSRPKFVSKTTFLTSIESNQFLFPQQPRNEGSVINERNLSLTKLHCRQTQLQEYWWLRVSTQLLSSPWYPRCHHCLVLVLVGPGLRCQWCDIPETSQHWSKCQLFHLMELSSSSFEVPQWKTGHLLKSCCQHCHNQPSLNGPSRHCTENPQRKQHNPWVARTRWRPVTYLGSCSVWKIGVRSGEGQPSWLELLPFFGRLCHVVPASSGHFQKITLQ